MLKFRLRKGKGSVSEFVDSAGNRSKPGDIVDLPPQYKGERWLEVVDPVKPAKPMREVKQDAKVENQNEQANVVPLAKKTRKKGF